jgi:hypothetical protein
LPSARPTNSPFFEQTEKAHGRLSIRGITYAAVGPTESGFPYASLVIRVRCRQSATSDWENRYYISSAMETCRNPEGWAQRVRAHWMVENANHWRKDATLREDATRTRNPRIMANLILLRNLVLHYYEPHRENFTWLPIWIEHNQANPQSVFTRVTENK